jgi:hypothetical protein
MEEEAAWPARRGDGDGQEVNIGEDSAAYSLCGPIRPGWYGPATNGTRPSLGRHDGSARVPHCGSGKKHVPAIFRVWPISIKALCSLFWPKLELHERRSPLSSGALNYFVRNAVSLRKDCSLLP